MIEIDLEYEPNSYYGTPGVRDTCHVLKEQKSGEDYRNAVKLVADYMMHLGIVSDRDYLIPVPQHTGRAEYTLDIAEMLSGLTGAKVLDVLGRVPSDSWYDLKKKGVTEMPSFFLKSRDVPSEGRLFFLDNVLSTGTTYAKVSSLFSEKLTPLVYALGYSFDDENFVNVIQ